MSSERATYSRETRDEDTMRILLATDCHLGYELSTKRQQDNDSFIAFEEILQHAKDQDVDFILLGGDLFHDCRPPQKIVLQCMELLKKYVLGDREINVEFLSDPEIIFEHSAQKVVNYEDPNMNIAMPIFSIHGNHDNPSFASVGSMDLLGASGLINYFGKWSDMTHVSIPPMVFRKGATYLSIYGLSYMNDQRLSRLLRDQKFSLKLPELEVEPFQLLTLHQNRAKHTENGYVDEHKLPPGLDLVFWGHEHECRVEPEHFTNSDFDSSYYISQPGSSVATSLCEGEAVQKKIGILEINSERKFKIKPIKLQTVRPFVFESISLRDMDIKLDLTRPHADVICEFVDDYIDRVLMAKAQLQITGHPNQPTVPLIRLRIFYSQEAEMFDPMRITRKYCDRVANPRDIILLRKEKAAPKDSKIKLEQNAHIDADINECFRNDDDDTNWNKTVQGQIQNFFNRGDKKNDLKVLSVGGLNEALRSFVEASDDNAFDAIVKHQVAKNMEYLKQFDVDEEQDIIEQLEVYRSERNANEGSGDDERDARQFLESDARKKEKPDSRGRTGSTSRDNSDFDANDDDVVLDEVKQQPARGRGRGSRARGRGAKAALVRNDYDDDEEPAPPPTRGRGKGSRGGGARSATGKARGAAQKPAVTRGPLDVSFDRFAPRGSSSMMRPPSTATIKDEDSSVSQFRVRPSQHSEALYVEDSDSD